MSATIHIALNGCDDQTFLAIEVTEEGAEALSALEKAASDAAESGCQPTVEIREVSDCTDVDCRHYLRDGSRRATITAEKEIAS